VVTGRAESEVINLAISKSMNFVTFRVAASIKIDGNLIISCTHIFMLHLSSNCFSFVQEVH